MFWSNLFKKKNYSTNIVNNISSKIPSFEELTPEEQEYVSNLKEEYLKFYENEDNYISLDSELFNEIKMYQDLALDIMHNDHFGNIASSIIDSKKLVYYSHKITELNNTLKYKYIALCELRKAKKYLTKHMGLYVLGRRKINILKALDHQINIINNMFVISNQKITDYCACAIANYPKSLDEYQKIKLLKGRLDRVVSDYQDLFNKSINLDKNLPIDDIITYAEILLNKFVYENKCLISKLKEQLDLIANSEIKDKNKQQEIIDNLMKIKNYYNIFYNYGRNLIDDKDIEDLYQIIFNVYTYFPLDCSFSEYYNSLPPSKEKSTYTKIVKSKLEIFKLGKSKIFETTDIPKEELIKWADKKYFKFDRTYYYYYDQYQAVVNHCLKILLLMDHEHGLEQFFESTIVNLKNYDLTDILFTLSYDILDRDITKYSFYKLLFGMYLNIYSPLQEQIYSLEDHIGPYNYYNIYEVIDELEIFRKIYKDKIFFNNLPEGIKYFNTKNFDSYIKNYCLNKTITLPNSVNKVDITFNYYENIEIKCPDKLEKLKINIMSDGMEFFPKCPCIDIILPSNLDKFSIHTEAKYKSQCFFYLDRLKLIHNYKILDLNYKKLYLYFYKIIYTFFENKHDCIEIIFGTIRMNDLNNNVRQIKIYDSYHDSYDKKVETLKGVDNLAKIIADYILKNKDQIKSLMTEEIEKPKTLIKK